MYDSPLSKILSAYLIVPSQLYSGIIRLRQRLYKTGFFKSLPVNCKVISIGNLVMGGTGKTPLTIYTAKLLEKMGFRVAVISRGYRGKKGHDGGLVSNGSSLFMTPDDAGDEPYLIARNCPSVAVLIGKNRFRAGMTAIQKFSTQVLLLDDGFQHLTVKRDMNIVLLDASAPVGNGRIFPAGPLREPVQGLTRADVFIFTRCGNSVKTVPKSVAAYLGNKPELYCRHIPDRLIGLDAAGNEMSFEPGHLKDLSLLAFSGIAHNQDFLSMLESMNYRIASFKAYPDHHRYSSRDLGNLLEMAKKVDVQAMITTEKDYVKVFDRLPDRFPLYALRIKISFDEFETRFKNLLKAVMKN